MRLRHRRFERVQGVFLSHVGGPSFTAAKQCAENGCFVDVHFGAFSLVFFFHAFLVKLNMTPVALPIL